MTKETPPVRLYVDWPVAPDATAQLPAAAFLTSTLWSPGQTITVGFIDRSAPAWKKAWVRKVVAEEVQPYVNLKLQWVPDTMAADADIRITFAHENQAYSRLGTQSTWFKGDRSQPESMNLGWLDEPWQGSFTWEGKTYKLPGCTWCSKNQNGSVIIHEFGHALGMIHEHQSPGGGGINWDREAVYRYFSGNPNYWSRDQIDFNVLERYDAQITNFSDFDPRSVMLYAFSPQLTLDGVGTTANPRFSELDKEWLQVVYGPTTNTPPPKPVIEVKTEIGTGEGGTQVETEGETQVETEVKTHTSIGAIVGGVVAGVVVVVAVVLAVVLTRRR